MNLYIDIDWVLIGYINKHQTRVTNSIGSFDTHTEVCTCTGHFCSINVLFGTILIVFGSSVVLSMNIQTFIGHLTP